MRGVRDIDVLENIPVLVRAALNVPVENGHVVNEYRLRHALPTIRFLTERGARVILISHIGSAGTETLAPVAEALGTHLRGVSFVGETIGERVRAAVRDLTPGNVLVLENLRRARGEKENDHSFAKELAALADVFVQDSFDTCHRQHASIVTLPTLLPAYAGLLLEKEVHELSLARSPKSPSLAVIGGAKFTTKEAVLTTLVQAYDNVYVGGALANDFFKSAGHEVGKSLVCAVSDKEAMRPLLENKKIVLPTDVLVVPESVAGSLNAHAEARVASIDAVGKDEMILDVGPASSAELEKLATKATTLLWNGPLGNYEHGFSDATNALARAVAESRAHSVIGGGDTVAAIEKLGLLSRFSFVSTGGGAMLDYLAYGTLPGLVALK